MLNFAPLFGKTTRDQVADFEAHTKLSLPDAYRRFLLTCNGGQPSPHEIDIPGCGEAAIVDLLYGISDSRQPGDLQKEYDEQHDTLPEGFLPIGHDPGGNGFLLGTVGESRDRVYYWDSSFFFESSDEDHNTYPVRGTFDEFLSSLK